MKILFLIVFAFTTACCYAQADYLAANRQDMRASDFSFPQADFKIMGFGALHGSQKTEDAEFILLNHLVQKGKLQYYFPETDYSTACYFLNYIHTGDEALLKELVTEYGARVPQEATIAVFNKWKELRPLFKDNKVNILGIDPLASYKFSVKHMLELMSSQADWEYIYSLKKLLEHRDTDWSAYYPTPAREILKLFVIFYHENRERLRTKINDVQAFNHIIRNIEATFTPHNRETLMYENFMTLYESYDLANTQLFFRMGVFHIMKGRINAGKTFFTQLLEGGKYKSAEVITIQGFLADSKVLWDIKYDKNGKYSGYTTQGGNGTADNLLEHYQGIKTLKKNKLSDLTLFRLNGEGSPYSKPGTQDLVKLDKLLGKSPWKPASDKVTTDYLNYALLITGSEAGIPVQEM